MPVTLDEYLGYINRKEIPPSHPEYASTDRWGWVKDKYDYKERADIEMQLIKARSKCIDKNLWPMIHKEWTQKIAQWINGRKCLEIMAGLGWLSKALNEDGIDIVATDSHDEKWMGKYKTDDFVFEVEKIDAVSAVKKYCDKDILIVSWPPHEDVSICKACEEWGSNKPVVYIGEMGGCNAPDDFFEHFVEIEDAPTILLHKWPGLFDEIIIGRWKT